MFIHVQLIEFSIMKKIAKMLGLKQEYFLIGLGRGLILEPEIQVRSQNSLIRHRRVLVAYSSETDLQYLGS